MKFIFCYILFFFAIVAQGQQSNPFDIGSAPKAEVIKPEPVASPQVSSQPNLPTGNPFDMGRPAVRSVESELPVYAPSDDIPSEVSAETQTNTNSAPQANAFDIGDKPKNQGSNNPFDLNKGGNDAVVNTPIASPRPKVKVPNRPSPKGEVSNGFLFMVFLVIGLILTFVATLYRPYIDKIFKGFTNENLMSLLYRERHSNSIRLPSMLLYITAVLSVGAFLFSVLNYYKAVPLDYAFLTVLLCIGSIGLLFFLKHSILNFISWAFPVYKESDLYEFNIGLFNKILGLVLLPFGLLMAFSTPGMKQSLLYIAIALVALLYIYRSIRGLVIGSKYLISNKFHFFLYLCTVEIAPVLILFKLLDNYTGIV